MECQHDNATVELLEYSKPSWWADAHCYVNDDSEDLPTLVCPDCGFEEFLQDPKHQKEIELALEYEKQRTDSVRKAQANCRHELVYNKIDDDYHCHYCDLFMYRGCDD